MRLQNIYDSIEPAIMRKVEGVISKHEKEYRCEILAESSPTHGLMKQFYDAYTSNAADRIMSTPLVNEESTEDTITIRRPYQYTELSKLYSEEDIGEWRVNRQRLAAAADISWREDGCVFGAIPDGETDSTQAIQDWIDRNS